jgi:hypothetical protein
MILCDLGSSAFSHSLGHSLQKGDVCVTSAIPPIATLILRCNDGGNVPKLLQQQRSARAPMVGTNGQISSGVQTGCFIRVGFDRVLGKPLHLSKKARRMGGANGSCECAPDDKLRDTRQLQFAKMMGFAKGSTHPTGLICPTGWLVVRLSSPIFKNISLRR